MMIILIRYLFILTFVAVVMLAAFCPGTVMKLFLWVDRLDTKLREFLEWIMK